MPGTGIGTPRASSNSARGVEPRAGQGVSATNASRHRGCVPGVLPHSPPLPAGPRSTEAVSPARRETPLDRPGPMTPSPDTSSFRVFESDAGAGHHLYHAGGYAPGWISPILPGLAAAVPLTRSDRTGIRLPFPAQAPTVLGAWDSQD